MEYTKITMRGGTKLDFFCRDFQISWDHLIGYTQNKDTGFVSFSVPLSKKDLGLVPDMDHMTQEIKEELSEWLEALGYPVPMDQVSWIMADGRLIGSFVQLYRFPADENGSLQLQKRLNQIPDPQIQEQPLFLTSIPGNLLLYLNVRAVNANIGQLWQRNRFRKLMQEYSIISVA